MFEKFMMLWRFNFWGDWKIYLPFFLLILFPKLRDQIFDKILQEYFNKKINFDF
jgi:hypothetical protein